MDKEDFQELVQGMLWTFVGGMILMLFLIANNFQTFKCVFYHMPMVKQCRNL